MMIVGLGVLNWVEYNSVKNTGKFKILNFKPFSLALDPSKNKLKSILYSRERVLRRMKYSAIYGLVFGAYLVSKGM